MLGTSNQSVPEMAIEKFNYGNGQQWKITNLIVSSMISPYKPPFSLGIFHYHGWSRKGKTIIMNHLSIFINIPPYPHQYSIHNPHPVVSALNLIVSSIQHCSRLCRWVLSWLLCVTPIKYRYLYTINPSEMELETHQLSINQLEIRILLKSLWNNSHHQADRPKSSNFYGISQFFARGIHRNSEAFHGGFGAAPLVDVAWLVALQSVVSPEFSIIFPGKHADVRQFFWGTMVILKFR